MNARKIRYSDADIVTILTDTDRPAWDRTAHLHAAAVERSRGEHPAYRAMLEASAALLWPERFVADLLAHDRNALRTRDPALPLFWVLRRCGTYLSEVTTDPIDGVGHRAWDAPRWFPRTFGEENYRFFTWDGVTLRDHGTDADRMADTLRDMAQAWREKARVAAEVGGP